MNLVEKILARTSGRASVAPGDVVVANVDRLIMHDLSGFLTAKVFDQQVKGTPRYPDRAVMVFDHHFSPPTEAAADMLKANRTWARRHGIRLFDCGNGNLHHVVVQRGLIRPGMVVVGSDSHTPVHGILGAFAAARSARAG
jgi:3-isopropylmalate/(R)-2-methylmalate dehydratase large subunit